MAISALPLQAAESTSERLASAVREGLMSQPKRLPPWLFYDETGSQLFERITETPEYYLTRTERGILDANAGAMIARAAAGDRLRIAELGAGSAEKTQLLLAAAARRQGPLVYEPLDVSASALDAARDRIERAIPNVQVRPLEVDYTDGLGLMPAARNERRLVLYVGSSIGNFEPMEAVRLLRQVRAGLVPADALLLGVDLVKPTSVLLPAYSDAAGVTAAFNRNMLVRLNRELGAEFDPDAFAHRAIWNGSASRIEMHLVSREAQSISIAALDLQVDFEAGESIHTENSYKFGPGQAEALLKYTGMVPEATWMDDSRWFAVCLARVV